MTNAEALAKVYEYIGRLKNTVPKSEQQEKSKTENMEFAVAVGTALEYRVEQKPIIRPYTNKRNSDKGYFARGATKASAPSASHLILIPCASVVTAVRRFYGI